MASVSRFRLRSSAFERPEERERVKAKRCVFLSVEGDDTERDYFNGLNRHLDSSVITIEVLRHKKGDGYSDPPHVVGLLEEYLSARDGDLIPETIRNLFEEYSEEDWESYLNSPETLPHNKRQEIRTKLLLSEIDLDYRKYLCDMGGKDDVFGVVLDRDCGSHSREQLEQCIEVCKKLERDGYKIGFYLSNPCFEFWLLLHLCDVKKRYAPEQLEAWIRNADGSENVGGPRLVEKEVSGIARHKKKISSGKFDSWYWPNISTAAKRAKEFATGFPDLMENLGTNLPDLLREIPGTLSEN